MLIGSDHYWQLVTGTVVRGTDDPVAIHTSLGWVLTDPVSVSNGSQMHGHILLKTNSADGKSLNKLLRAFWDLESLGIQDKEQSHYDQFNHNISFVDGRYEVPLPWRSSFLLIILCV